MRGKSKLTMRDLADDLGLSVSVISRVLNGKADQYRISASTQKLVQDAAEEHGFSVNQLARGLRLQKTFTLGLLIPDISNSFFSRIAREVVNAARRQGYSTILCDTENDGEIEQQALSLLLDRAVDGLIVAPVGKETDHINSVIERRTPIVLVDRFFDDLDVPYVTSNNYQGAYDGMVTLLETGHRRIGYIQGIPDSVPNIERLRGYRQALAHFDIQYDPTLVVGTKFDEEDGFKSGTQLLTTDDPPTALLASSSPGALGAMRACLQLDRRIPQDVSLIGYDEYPYAALLAPPLTTIAQQTDSIANAAIELLIEWMDTGQRPQSASVMLDTRMVSRASVSPPSR